jgi:hypothetical protein
LTRKNGIAGEGNASGAGNGGAMRERTWRTKSNRIWVLLAWACISGVLAHRTMAGPIVREAPPPAVRMKGPVQLAGVPVLVSPTCGATLTAYPRTLKMSWEQVAGATSYDVQVDCLNCRQSGKWDSQVGEPYTQHVASGTTATMEFWGDNPGRWRVGANRGGAPESWSGWCDFTFRTNARSRMLTRPRGLDRRPDITGTSAGMTISGSFFPDTVKWGGTATLSDSQAAARVNGLCAFNIHYEMANVGATATAQYAPPAPGPRFTNVLYDDAVAASKQTDLYLAVGAVEGIDTQAYLRPGTHTLKLSLDDGNAIQESNEANNTFSLTYVLNGTCGAK